MSLSLSFLYYSFYTCNHTKPRNQKKKKKSHWSDCSRFVRRVRAVRTREAMAIRAAATRGLSKRLFSSFAFVPPPTTASATAPPPAEPSTNLFVSGLNKRTTSEALREAFAKFGEVLHARVVTDRVNGYSKGFGFVRYGSLDDAAEGIKGMDGKFLDGWVIFAEYARPRTPQPPPDHTGTPPSYPRY